MINKLDQIRSKRAAGQTGFTIIEVMIVLMIVGLIMLIVFMAVPALNRNSRNTQRRNDVASVLGAVSEWSSNNAGKLPSTGAEQTAAIANAKLGFYSGAVTFGTAAPTGTDAAVIVSNRKCNANGTALDPATVNRSSAVLFKVESGSGDVDQCQSS